MAGAQGYFCSTTASRRSGGVGTKPTKNLTEAYMIKYLATVMLSLVLVLCLTSAGHSAPMIIDDAHMQYTVDNYGGNVGFYTLAGQGAVRLTDLYANQAGSVFTKNTLNIESFTTSFDFVIGANDGTYGGPAYYGTFADGFTFTIQGLSPTALGGAGGFLGYNGIDPSIGVGFDTYPDVYYPQTIKLFQDGNTQALLAYANPVMSLVGGVMTCWVEYDGTTLNIWLWDRNSAPLLSYDLDLVSILGDTTAYVGFTAGTGSVVSSHDIVSWDFTSTAVTPTPEPGTMMLLGSGVLALFGLRRKSSRNS